MVVDELSHFVYNTRRGVLQPVLSFVSMSDASARFADHVGELELVLKRLRDGLFAEAARVVSRECGETEGAPGPWRA